MNKYDYITATTLEEKVRLEKLIKYMEDNNIEDDRENKTPTPTKIEKIDDMFDENVPTGVALGGIGTLITSLIAMAIFKKRR